MHTIEADASSGARAVEVVAMLGNSIVDVKHCSDPEAGKVQPTTWALLAIAVDPEVANCVAEVLAGIAFPKPTRGGGVQVTYPFTFRSAG